MNCLRCNVPLENTYRCPHCGHENPVAKKIIYASNWHYNQGLAKAKVRDLQGASDSLKKSLKYNKSNTDARNLLGLIYYQTGEIVAALSEWVISLHFQQNNNRAAEYIYNIQSNPAKLKETNRIIQKYNSALQYIEENNADMAIIELKKVVNISPNYIRAYQLLALLYIQRKQYTAAKKVLMRAVKIDRNNITTLNYLNEINRVLGKNKSNQVKDEFVPINDPNPIVIEEKQDTDFSVYNTGFLSFVNVLIGIVIGAAVIWLLLIPSMSKNKANEYNQAIVEYSAQLSERNREINSLQEKIASLEVTISQYESSGEIVVNDAGASDRYLITAMSQYLQGNLEETGRMLAEVDPAAIVSSDKTKIYGLLKEETKNLVVDDLYEEAYDHFANGEYVDTIDGMVKVLRLDDSYTSAIFYLGRSYQQLGDITNAISYYKRLVSGYPNSRWYEDANNYLEQLDSGNSVTETDTISETESESDVDEDSIENE